MLRIEYCAAISTAADIIFKHYGEQFGQKTRQEIRESDAGLLNLYDAVRTYYRTFLKTSGKGRSGLRHKSKTSAISTVLPKNNSALFALLGRWSARFEDHCQMTADCTRVVFVDGKLAD